MAHVDRFTVSLDTELLAAFDGYLQNHGYVNRSEAIRDLIRERLTVSHDFPPNKAVVAVVTGVCRHEFSETGRQLRDKLVEFTDVVLGMQVTAVDGDRDWVMINLKGPSGRVHLAADRIQAMRGIAHGHLEMFAVEK